MRIFKQTFKNKGGEKKLSSKWYCEFRDHLRKTRRMPAHEDKKASEAVGRGIEKLVAVKARGEQPDPQLSRWLECLPSRMLAYFVKVGLIDKARSGKMLAEHVVDFRQSLLDKGDTLKTANETKSRVLCICRDCSLVNWSDIQASKVQRSIVRLGAEKDWSKRTANFYLKAFKHFCSWMVEDQRASTSPVTHLRTVEVQKKDIRRPRRPLEVDEVRRLLEVARTAPKMRGGPTGYERSLIYRLACESGLRANEIRLLKVEDFDFNNCTVTVLDHTAKNRREKTLPLRPDTASDIKDLLANKFPAARAFTIPTKIVNMLKPDLKLARIEYMDDAGRYADFHSLRHTCGSLLAASGVHPKVAQEIMRHSDINLTMGIYTHTMRGQEADAVNSLPDLSQPSKESQKRTGTDNVTVTNATGRSTGRFCATDIKSHKRSHGIKGERTLFLESQGGSKPRIPVGQIDTGDDKSRADCEREGDLLMEDQAGTYDPEYGHEVYKQTRLGRAQTLDALIVPDESDYSSEDAQIGNTQPIPGGLMRYVPYKSFQAGGDCQSDCSDCGRIRYRRQWRQVFHNGFSYQRVGSPAQDTEENVEFPPAQPSVNYLTDVPFRYDHRCATHRDGDPESLQRSDLFFQQQRREYRNENRASCDYQSRPGCFDNLESFIEHDVVRENAYQSEQDDRDDLRLLQPRKSAFDFPSQRQQKR